MPPETRTISADQVSAGLDHVIAAVADVRGTLGTFVDLVGLPVAVPWAEFPTWQSAGIWVGNACVFFDSSGTSKFLTPTDPPRWRALSLRPGLPIDKVADHLRRTGFRVDGPKPYVEGGDELWSNAYVPGVLADDEMLFFTQYGRDRRAQFAAAHEAFVRSRGGPLGVTGVYSIGAGADVQWPLVYSRRKPGSLLLADGVQIELDGAGSGLTYLALRVRNLTIAAAYLDGRDVAAHFNRGVLRIDPGDTCGLDLRLSDGSGGARTE